MKKAECKHRVDKPKTILQWLDDAEERQRREERQRKCPCCLLWIWESQYYISRKAGEMKPFKVGDLVTLAFPGIAVDYSGVWKIVRKTCWRGAPFLYIVQKLSDDKKAFQSNYKEAFHASWLVHYRQRNRKKGQHAQRNKS